MHASLRHSIAPVAKLSDGQEQSLSEQFAYAASALSASGQAADSTTGYADECIADAQSAVDLSDCAATNEEPQKGGGLMAGLTKFMADLDEAVWDGFQGRKERIWSPDRRPKDMQNRAFDFASSSLSWGCNGQTMTDEVAATLRAVVETPAESTSSGSDAALLCDGRGGLTGELAGMAATAEQVPTSALARETCGRELAELCFAKYGRYHDMTILRNKVVGSWQVAFNIYGPCLGQRSFSYTEEQYLQKLDTAALMLNSWDQAWYVKEFLTEPVRPRAGLPSRPRPDSAVTLRLNNSPNWNDVDPDEVDSWFSIGLG